MNICDVDEMADLCVNVFEPSVMRRKGLEYVAAGR